MTNANSIAVSKRSLWSALGLIVVMGFSWFQFVGYLGPGFIEIFELKPEAPVLEQHPRIILIPAISFFLVSTMIALAINIKRPLKSVSKRGLLLASFIFGPFLAILFGLVMFLMGSLTMGFITGGGLMGFALILAWGFTLEFEWP